MNINTEISDGTWFCTFDRIAERVMLLLIFASGMCLVFGGLAFLYMLAFGGEDKPARDPDCRWADCVSARDLEQRMCARHDCTNAASGGVLYVLHPVVPNRGAADHDFNDRERDKSDVGHHYSPVAGNASILRDSDGRLWNVVVFEPTHGAVGEVCGDACGHTGKNRAECKRGLNNISGFHAGNYTTSAETADNKENE